MAPTLGDGDDVLLDLRDAGDRLRDGIYVLRVDERLLVKRLAVHPMGRHVTVQSDNPAYPDWPDCAIDDVVLHRPGDLGRAESGLAASLRRSLSHTPIATAVRWRSRSAAMIGSPRPTPYSSAEDRARNRKIPPAWALRRGSVMPRPCPDAAPRRKRDMVDAIVDGVCARGRKPAALMAVAMQDHFIAGRGARDRRLSLIDEYGADAPMAAAMRAVQSRDAGNVLKFCHWRQIERLSRLLASNNVEGSLH